jgi:hypothetical protein
MLKYLFKPYYSVFELLSLMYVSMIMITVSFWIGLFLIPVHIMTQVFGTYMMNKKESIKQTPDSVV